MSTVIVFDMDDTLYSEMTYVKSGMQAVSHYLETLFQWPVHESYHTLLALLHKEGRGQVFDRLLARHNIYNKKLIQKCIKIYRHHTPSITLDPHASTFLTTHEGPKYLVTDGHKIVQHKKILALGLSTYFKKCYITHRYGIANAKPSLHCFELIRTIESIPWEQLVYVGDNPAKDFVNLNKVGATTIRVLTGAHSKVLAKSGYDAGWAVNNLSELSQLLSGINKNESYD